MDALTDAARTVRVKDDYLARVLAGEEFLLFDGAMGTMIQREGLSELVSPPDLLNLSHADEVEKIQRAYVEAGSQVIETNTFNANRLKLACAASVADVYAAAARIARAAGARYVAGGIGPTGQLLEPMGAFPFEKAYDVFAEQARAIEAAGCDLVIIETMSDLREAKAAVLAAMAETTLPVFATMTFGEGGRTFAGTTPGVAAVALSALGVSAVGVNCSLGPDAIAPVVEEIARYASCPVMVQPNAGLPRVVGGETVYDVTPEDFVRAMGQILDTGATIVGGCCGTDPSFIEGLAGLIAGRRPASPEPCGSFAVASVQRLCALDQADAEEVLAAGTELLANEDYLEALADEEYEDAAEEIADAQEGAEVVCVRADAEGVDEREALPRVVEALQETEMRPIAIVARDAVALEAAARAAIGAPLIALAGETGASSTVADIARRTGCIVAE